MDPWENLRKRKLHAYASRGADQHLIGIDTESNCDSIRHLFCGTESGRTRAGISIATVQDDSMRFPILQMMAGKENRSCLHKIRGKNTCRSCRNLGDHQA